VSANDINKEHDDMYDNTDPANEHGSGALRCSRADCVSGKKPPVGSDICNDCAAADTHFASEQQHPRERLAELEASLAHHKIPEPGPRLAALLARFGPGSRLGMTRVHDLQAGDVFAWPCAHIRAVTEADRRDYGQRTFEVFYAHDAEEALPAYESHLVMRPADPQTACSGCGRTFTEGCTEPCHDRFITEDEIRAVFAEAGMPALSEPDGA
jgi:hypothetical protein